MQTPPLSARIAQMRVIRVLAVTIFLAATIASSLSLAPQAAEAASTRTTTALNLRAGPGTKYDVILVMPSGASVTVGGNYSKGFYPIRYQGIKGWASADYLTNGGNYAYQEVSYQESASGTAYTTTSLNLRSGPSTGDSVITVMRSGAAVTLTGQSSNGFVSVNYNGTSGWAYESYLGAGGGSDSGSGSTDSATGTAYTTTAVNLRSGAGTSYSIITVVPSGASVSLRGSTSNNFVSVTYNGSNGWLYADYVSSSGGSSGSGSGSGSGAGSDGSWSTDEIIDLIYEAAAYYGQNGDDMLRVARCESGLDPNNVTPPYQASGLFQFLPSTWASTPYASQDIFDPEASAYAAAWMWSVGRRNEWVCQ